MASPLEPKQTRRGGERKKPGAANQAWKKRENSKSGKPLFIPRSYSVDQEVGNSQALSSPLRGLKRGELSQNLRAEIER